MNMKGALKFEAWLNKRTLEQQKEHEQYKLENPDRYFVAFVEIYMPRATLPEHIWPRKINDTLLFEQEDMPSINDVVETARRAWGVASRIDLINFYEVNVEDYQKLFGDEGDWEVID